MLQLSLILQPCATAADVQRTVVLPITPCLIVQGRVDLNLVFQYCRLSISSDCFSSRVRSCCTVCGFKDYFLS